MQRNPGDAYEPEPTVLERKAARLLEGYGQLAAAERIEHDGDRRALLRTATRWAVALAVVAGVISGGIIGGSEIWMRQSFGLDDMEFWDALPLWIAWFAVAGVVSAVEIAFLYWVAIKGIGRVIGTARVELGDDGYPCLFARGFARGALEFPNPRREIWGIDPYAYVPRWKLLARTLAYKMKVGITSFILRVFLRRVAARMAIRGLVPLMAGPLYAAWNAFIIWRIMTEARVRAFGPAAIDRMLEAFEGEVSEASADIVLHGVGEITRRAGDMHPNYVYLMARLRERFGIEIDKMEVDWPHHRDRLDALDETEREQVLRLLTLAAVLGSKTYGGQRAVVEEALGRCGREASNEPFKELRRALVDGTLAVPEGLDRAVCGRRAAA